MCLNEKNLFRKSSQSYDLQKCFLKQVWLMWSVLIDWQYFRLIKASLKCAVRYIRKGRSNGNGNGHGHGNSEGDGKGNGYLFVTVQ
jgi:hypothetical protein